MSNFGGYYLCTNDVSEDHVSGDERHPIIIYLHNYLCIRDVSEDRVSGDERHPIIIYVHNYLCIRDVSEDRASGYFLRRFS